MTKQIHFYLLQEDFAKVENYLRENFFKIISSRNLTEYQPVVLDFLQDSTYQKLLVREELIGALKYISYPNSQESYVDILKSPVIEFSEGMFVAESKEFFRGNLCYTIEDSSLFKSSDDAVFEKTSKQLFSWFKRQFKRFPHPDLAWSYASQEAIDLVMNGNGKILLNQSPTTRIYFDKGGIQQELVLT